MFSKKTLPKSSLFHKQRPNKVRLKKTKFFLTVRLFVKFHYKVLGTLVKYYQEAKKLNNV